MQIQSADFLISSPDLASCPDSKLPEFAFIGRSNVGKSSLINALTRKKDLAMVSSTPGRTRLINFFVINRKWTLVDLPGYGYAKASGQHRNQFNEFVSDYIAQRTNLSCVFVLIDSRHTPQKIDLEFMNWCGEKNLPFSMVFTKIDKLSSTALQKNLAKYKKEMLKYWEELPPVFTTSATSGFGKEPILNYIGQILV